MFLGLSKYMWWAIMAGVFCQITLYDFLFPYIDKHTPQTTWGFSHFIILGILLFSFAIPIAMKFMKDFDKQSDENKRGN